MLNKKIIYIILIFFVFISNINAQDEEVKIEIINIIAIVNDEAITLADLINRLDLIIISSNLPNNPSTRENLSTQVVQTLIDEKLKHQEAKRNNISVSELEIEKSISIIEQRNSLEKGTLTKTLINSGISEVAFMERIKSQIIWDKLLNKIVKPRIKINNKEIDNELNMILSNEGKKEYRYSEIFINFNKSQDKQNSIKTAIKIKNQINENNFGEIATQMSQSTSAKFGGLVSWGLVSSIPRPIYSAIQSMKLNQISDPIITNTGIYIIKLEGEREFRIPDLSKNVVKIATLKFNINENNINLKSYINENFELLGVVESCEQLADIQKSNPIKFGGFYGTILLKNLPTKFKEKISNLDPGNHTNPLYTQEGVYILMKCEQNKKINQEFALKELIKTKLQNKYFKMFSDRFILNLKRKALIDIRM